MSHSWASQPHGTARNTRRRSVLLVSTCFDKMCFTHQNCAEPLLSVEDFLFVAAGDPRHSAILICIDTVLLSLLLKKIAWNLYDIFVAWNFLIEETANTPVGSPPQKNRHLQNAAPRSPQAGCPPPFHSHLQNLSLGLPQPSANLPNLPQRQMRAGVAPNLSLPSTTAKWSKEK